MVVQPKPLAVEQEMMFRLGIGPGASRKCCDRLAEGQVDALDEGGLDERTESCLA